MTHIQALLTASVLRLLGDAQLRLYDASHNARNLDASILTTQLAVAIISASSTLSAKDVPLLLDLGSRFTTRYNTHGKLDDIHGAILSLRDASRLCQDGDPLQHAVYNQLGFCFTIRFGRLGGPDDIDDAVMACRRAVESLSDGDARKPMTLVNYGNACYMRFRRAHRPEDLDELVSTFSRGLELIPEDHPERPDLFDKLGNSYSMRFESNGRRPDDIEQAVSAHKRAVELTPDGHPTKPSRLHNLGVSLASRFSVSHVSADIEQAVSIHLQVAEVTPDGHPTQPMRLGILVETSYTRYTHTKRPQDLEQVILACERALPLTADSLSTKPLLHHRLGCSLLARYGRTKELEDLKHAVAANRRAVELVSDEDTKKLVLLRTFGDSSLELSDHTDDADDIERAAWAYQQAASLTPSDHSDHPVLLRKLGDALARLFERTGNSERITQAVGIHRRMVELTKDDDPERPFRLLSLATTLGRRYERAGGEFVDLQGAISLFRHAMALVPDSHPAMPGLLSNFSRTLLIRFQGPLGGDLEDLEASINNYRYGIQLASDEHPHKAAMFSDLSLALSVRSERLGTPNDIEEALLMGRRALDSTPEGHPDLASYYNNVAKCLMDRHTHTKDIEDLSTAISMFRQATDLCPKDHPHLPQWLGNLGTTLRSRFEITRSQADFDSAVQSFASAATSAIGTPDYRLVFAIRWAGLLEKYPAFGTIEARLKAYSLCVTILPELIWLGFDVQRRLSDCRVWGSIVKAAVAAAVNMDSLDHAVEWIEGGRSLIWSQMFLLRAPLDELQEKQPRLATEFGRLNQLLQQSAPSSFTFDSDTFAGVAGVGVNAKGDRHRQLTFEHQRLLTEIRGCTGFEHFMERNQPEVTLPVPEALSGPIIFINVYRTRCDAIILHRNGARAIVPLPDLSSKKASDLRWRWVQEVMGYRYQSSRMDERASGNPTGRSPDRLRSCLRYLWNTVVGPILNALDYTSVVSDGRRLPHITWCPTGPLMQLPLHAAGLYDGPNGPRAYNFAVHSYIPSLSALARSCAKVDEQHLPRKVLIVTQPTTPNQMPLFETLQEASRLEDTLRTSGVEDKWLNDTDATVSSVRAAMTEYPWVHLACHGSQNMLNPLESAFVLYDGLLTLTDLMTTTTDTAELAFLSACETAVGDVKTPEESTHLAAGMLAVGFKGVVATMWSIQDADAPVIVGAYYKELLAVRSSGSLSRYETGAAYALHEATRLLRDEVGEGEFARWVPFVHFGI
ncbi:unnamed protein product [Peniophora sp. CBMAI 1063]|nr:unnamed protein product [Peniophora sp. CBMAI 1063]